ncbi:hypothetical protein BD309DRAFT_1027146 [Dichomitus squalens]|uniref:Uncharacterized protein n=1 Tax=Dichomitus squalens TaxID=114155 RepID=A0A4Q9PNJ3_9APHY|nr:hypothetical protein BD309DRAFT_1027146 [Dichomitus squalens]TBU55862.1 hypothetical protein BD310DRAFT_932659 [Dichomitus squalens]
MSARRQASTTSLSRYARAGSPDFSSRSLDFCNAFWGLGDGGVEVLFARMRGAMRTMEELRSFWKERAAIEQQYASKLAALAKITLGRDEIGELRASLDTLKQETEKQAQAHLVVAQAIKADLEGPTSAFIQKQQHHKRNLQAAIEKEFKTKQTQEGYVNRAREKYEADCVRINSYTAQSTLIQGRDLEKVHLKLERAQQTVQANQRDYANFARALQDTMQKWEHSWKGFCDSCQDLEEERIEFMKDNMWAYANAVSTVCVSDDESCEKLRLALEQLEVERDMENFVRDYGTGNAIPDPPPFIDYTSPDAQPASSQRPSTHTSNFARQTQRQRQAPMPLSQPEPEPEPPVDMTGVGAAAQPPQRSGTQSRASTRGGDYPQQANGAVANGRVTPNVGTRPADPHADPIDPTATTMLRVGPNAYEVNLDRDPQANGVSAGAPNSAAARVGQDDDPLQRQLNELRNAGGGSVRRSGQWKPQTTQSPPGASGLSPPPGTTQRNRDYRNSAEIVVGSYPAAAPPAASRPTSPNITNVHMRPPSTQGPPSSTSGISVQSVLQDYQQSFPGERKSISRSNSRSNSISIPQGSSIRERPLSSESGQAGIGAQGRSTSPQPFAPLSRSASPAMQGPPVSNRNSFGRPPAGGPPPGAGHAHSGSNVRQGSISIPSQPAHQQRPTSPGIGIQLDPSGRVVADDMAAIYQRQPQQTLPAQPQPPYGAPPPVPAAQQPIQRRPSYNAGPNGAPFAGGPQYGAGQAPVYNQPPQQYAPPVQPPQQTYGAPPPQQGGYTQGYQQQQQAYGQQQQGGALVQRGPSVNGYFPQQPQQAQPLQQQQQQQQYRAPSPRAPSPQPQGGQPPPTGQYTDDGRGVLFYVKAMYNYRATIDEEFDFQEGDIIAVTATPEDGWWSGELLDETRRQPGRHIFPSNFVCLF